MMNLNRKQRRGFTLIELLIVIAVIAILAAIAIPNLLSSRESANEASCIGSMRTINSAEATYRSRNNAYGLLAGGATSSATAKSGYYYAPAVVSTTQYWITASPIGSGGTRFFYTDETGVIWAAPSATASLPTADASGNVTTTGWAQIGN